MPKPAHTYPFRNVSNCPHWAWEIGHWVWKDWGLYGRKVPPKELPNALCATPKGELAIAF